MITCSKNKLQFERTFSTDKEISSVNLNIWISLSTTKSRWAVLTWPETALFVIISVIHEIGNKSHNSPSLEITDSDFFAIVCSVWMWMDGHDLSEENFCWPKATSSLRRCAFLSLIEIYENGDYCYYCHQCYHYYYYDYYWYHFYHYHH